MFIPLVPWIVSSVCAVHMCGLFRIILHASSYVLCAPCMLTHTLFAPLGLYPASRHRGQYALAFALFWVYCTFYTSSADSRWHECGHGTAFKTKWMNDVMCVSSGLHSSCNAACEHHRLLRSDTLRHLLTYVFPRTRLAHVLRDFRRLSPTTSL